MKILLTSWYREWRGSEPQVLRPDTFSLDEKNTLFALVVSLGNGEFDEACIETDSGEAKECIEGLLCGTGGAKRVEVLISSSILCHGQSCLRCVSLMDMWRNLSSSEGPGSARF